MDAQSEAPERPDQRELVRAAIFARRMRDDSFPGDLFGEPAWDCLLDLYLAALEKRRLSVTDVCVAATVPPTTALRWVDILCRRDLAVRGSDALDGGRSIVELTRKGEALMSCYFHRASTHWNGC